ncbi:MAG: DUF3999 domain-containing protein [Deltaproteobacteria bacterium]|nr:MAG: DUF3999 domain-containing protein [Deltaproteobacteria bacterium]
MTRLAVALGTLLALAAHAADPGEVDLRRLFPRQAEVYVTPPGGLSELRLPAEVLAACRPDLSDLRLFDRRGLEIPYVIDAGPEARTRAEVADRVEAQILEARREEIGRADAPALRREAYVVVAPTRTTEVGTWDLVMETDRPRFVRRVDVRAEAADGTGVQVLENASVFRLGAQRDKTRLPLPPLSGARLTVTVEGEEDFYLEPRLFFEGAHVLAARAEAAVDLAEVARQDADGRTVLELARPRGLVPDVLRLRTTTGNFDRPVEVWDEGPGVEPVLLGRADVFRVQALARAEEREVSLRAARGDRLRVEIVNGDSAALDALEFEAIVRRPSLIFSLDSDDGEAPAATLAFGGGRAYRPRYDLARLLGPAGARAGAALRDAARSARLGAVGPNPIFDGAPALGFAMRAGAEVDTRLYARRRRITVAPSPDGLSRLSLTAEDVAHARPDLADVRVVDAASRQWPYLLDRDGVERWERVSVEAPIRRQRTSRYRFGLRAAPARLDQLVLDADTPFFDRAFRLVATTEREPERVLAAGRLRQPIGKPGPVTIAFPPSRIDGLELVVEDGDDASLAFRAARARLRLPEVYLAAPAGEYSLLVGDPEATAPDYELARMRDVVLALTSAPVVTQAPGPNPDYSARARLTSGERLQGTLAQAVLWAVLLAAVAVLVLLTLRLARSGDPR